MLSIYNIAIAQWFQIKMTCSIILKQLTSDTKDAFVQVYNNECQVLIHDMSLCRLVQKQQVNDTVIVYKNSILTQYNSDTDPAQKRYWPGTKAILISVIQKRYCLIPFLVPLHNVSVPAVPEPVKSLVLVYGIGTCTGTMCKRCIERCRI